jgi:PAS domain S-box-containing protein
MTGEFSTTLGDPHFATYFSLPAVPNGESLIAETALPVSTLRATERRAQAILIASTCAVAILGAVLGAWLVRRLTAPLAELTATAERISQGDFMTAVPVHTTSAEVTTLSAALARSQAAMLEALEESAQARDWLFSLIQSIDEGVLAYEPSGTITFLGRSAETMSGWLAAEAIGHPLDEVLPISEPPGASWLEYAPPPGNRRQIEATDRHGHTLILDVSGAQMSPPGADDVHMALVLRDVTEEAAQQRLRSYFLDSITHEFRTPLSTLSASLELLLDTEVDLSAGEMRELLKPTHIGLLTLQQLVDNVLTSSRIEAGRFTVHLRPTELDSVITGALQLVTPMLERRRQTFTIAEPARPITVMADPCHLTQALANLLTNASKYGPIGAPIDMMISTAGGWMRLAVADRGPGIPAAERTRLFERFVRLPGDHEQYGIGLGLAIVKSVVGAHHGRLGVGDRPGGGAIFWFELPLPDAVTIAETTMVRNLEGDEI